MLSNLDDRRQVALSEFARLLTASADRSYCGTIACEVTVHRGEVRAVRLPQNSIVDLPPAASDKQSTLRAV